MLRRFHQCVSRADATARADGVHGVGRSEDQITSSKVFAHYLAISPRDEIFVADTLNWRVQKYVRE
jgi:hypothetical protein